MVACGCTIEAAARYVCCNVVTIRREARRNPEFHELLRKAAIRAQVTPVNVLHDAASSDWRAAAWLLERTDPHRFAKRAAQTYSEAEVRDLLGRVCDAVRRELRDKAAYARIKRHVKSIVQTALPQNATRRPAPFQGDVSPDDVAQFAPHEEEAENQREHAPDQNETKPTVVLTRMSDLPPSNSSPLPHADAT